MKYEKSYNKNFLGGTNSDPKTDMIAPELFFNFGKVKLLTEMIKPVEYDAKRIFVPRCSILPEVDRLAERVIINP